MSTLPRELITEILIRLPVKPLVRFQCVSKLWRALINDPFFINMHLKFSMAANRERMLILRQGEVHPPLDFFCVHFNDDDRFDRTLVKIRQPLSDPNYHTEILGYCNGLVCIHNCNGLVCIHNCNGLAYYDRDIAIWNPLIRRYKQLPIEPIENPCGLTDCLYGLPHLAFGYDPVSDDYKVMRVVELDGRNEVFEVKIYSLRAHSWKRVEEEWPKGCFPSSRSASLNGAFHWLVAPSIRSRNTLLAFDLATEKFRLYPIPVQPAYRNSTLGLEVLKGCICVCVCVWSNNVNDVWVMKEYGVASSWSRLYTIVQGAVPWPWPLQYCKPLVYSKDGKKILMMQDFAFLFWYDIEEKRGRRVQFRRMPSSFDTAICVGTLVLLDGDRLIDPRKKKRRKRKKNNNPAEGLNLLVEAMEEVLNEEQSV